MTPLVMNMQASERPFTLTSLGHQPLMNMQARERPFTLTSLGHQPPMNMQAREDGRAEGTNDDDNDDDDDNEDTTINIAETFSMITRSTRRVKATPVVHR